MSLKLPNVAQVVPFRVATARWSRLVAMPAPASVPEVKVMLTERPALNPSA